MNDSPRSIEIGDTTVTRPAGYWTPAVHALLEHLHQQGFQGAPRAVRRDEEREVLTLVQGVTPGRDHVEPWVGDDQLTSVADLIRRYHDASRSFVPPAWAQWQPTSVPTTGTHVCHNDLYRGNIVFQDGQATGVIDFDFAHPADPIWDVAIAAWHWVPLSIGPISAHVPEDRWATRFRMFLDAYGLAPELRLEVLDTILAFLRRVLDKPVTDARQRTQAEHDLATFQKAKNELASALR